VAPQLLAARVLDIGAGTGVAARAALTAGAARVVALDPAAGMLHAVGPPVRAVVGEAGRLPMRDNAFDVALAALSLGHVPSLPRALREARRVARILAASAFAAGWSHPAKAAVDDAMAPFGFTPPPWYATLKCDSERQLDDPAAFTALAADAGYADVRVGVHQVPTGLTTAAELAAWRLGMAHLAPFVAALPAAARAEARRAAEEALVGAPPLVVGLVVFTAR
jgi:SAM-dependent methyltransferase